MFGTLARPFTFFFILFAVVACLLLLYLAPKFGFEKLRRVAALDALDEAVGFCSETARPLIWTFGFVAPGHPFFPGAIESFKYTVKKCATATVRVYYTSTSNLTTVMADDFAKQACLEVGHPEHATAVQGYWALGNYEEGLLLGGIIARYHAGALVGIGKGSGQQQNAWAIDCMRREKRRSIHRDGRPLRN